MKNWLSQLILYYLVVIIYDINNFSNSNQLIANNF